MLDLTIRSAISQIMSGQIRVPAFQRGFVWEANDVAFLMDSLYKGYPFGSILLWRTKERLEFERKLGKFRLPDANPDFPVDYILDGQQRITSVFGVFQTELTDGADEDWTKIFFDFKANPNAQESQFVALKESEFDPERHFLLRNFFDTTAYRKATAGFNDELAERIDKVQSVFKEARIPIQLLTTEDRATVAIVFERVNRRGVELDTLQLLSAWTWSEEFDLQRRFEELGEELTSFGFKDLSEDKDLLLKCCAAVFAGQATTNALVSLNGAIVRGRFQEVENGLKGAIDFLRDNLSVYALDNLPYSSLLIPLCVFFSIPGTEQLRYSNEQRQAIVRWFWRTCFSKRYNSQPAKSLQEDIDNVIKLKNKQPHELGNFVVAIESDYFKKTSFRLNTVSTKTFVLLLAQRAPLSFVSGSPVTLREVLKEYNKNEFHHLFPRAFLRDSAQNQQLDEGCLANFAFLSKADNNSLGGTAPSAYRKQMPADVAPILQRAICPESLFSDNYQRFVDERSTMLTAEANRVLA